MTTASVPTRRQLRFDSLDDVVRDAEHLLAAGYEKAGNWDLAQCCFHLAEWMRFPVEGFPKLPLPLRPVFWLLRKTIGKAKFRDFLESRTMPSGKPTLRETVAEPGGDAAKAVAALRESVAKFKAHAGPVHPSPLFGAMTKDEAERLQLVHCAHHLSFLVPRA